MSRGEPGWLLRRRSQRRGPLALRVVTERSVPRAVVAPTAVPARPASSAVARPLLAGAAVLGAVLSATAVALSTRTGLWLDEAQAVAIARLPLGGLVEALRTDGAPPLYYLLLHGWMALFGDSEVAVRSLSAVFAAGAVALAPVAGARLGGRRTAIAALALTATSPFLHRYGTEARMYSLVVFLVMAGYLAVSAALDRPTPVSLLGVAVVSGLLLLTHYWAIFLLATVAVVLLVRSRRRGAGPAPRLVLLAMAAGTLLFLPWVGSFLFQLRYTGAPWGSPPGVTLFESTLQAFAGGDGWVGPLGFALLGLAVVGLLGRSLSSVRIELHLSGWPEARPLAAVVAGTLLLGLLASTLAASAFAPRYAAVVLVPFLLLAARGLAVIEHRTLLALLAVTVVGLGLARSADVVAAPRTQARSLAAVINAAAGPGDLVAFCPDQLGPSVARLVTAPLWMAAYPPGSRPERVNWVDYRDRIRATGGRSFARSLVQSAGSNQVWLAWAPGYHGLGRSCAAVLQELRRLRPAGQRAQARDRGAFESASLWRFPPSPTPRNP